jgi:hypothetical protein
MPNEREVEAAALREENERLRTLINSPHNEDWLEGVRLEATHQIVRYPEGHDASKTALDWFWLIGYLAQKATWAAIAGDKEKTKHHTISTGAALLNWHRHVSGIAALSAAEAGRNENRPESWTDEAGNEWFGLIPRAHAELASEYAFLRALLAEVGEGLEPFVALMQKREDHYRTRGGNPDAFPDKHPSFDIVADKRELPLGVWRALRTLLAKIEKAIAG